MVINVSSGHPCSLDSRPVTYDVIPEANRVPLVMLILLPTWACIMRGCRKRVNLSSAKSAPEQNFSTPPTKG